MNRRKYLIAVAGPCLALTFALLVGCSGSDDNDDDAGSLDANITEDVLQSDVLTGDADAADSNQTDSDLPGDAGTDTGSDTGSDTENDVTPADMGQDTSDAKPLDFEIRKPQEVTVHCPATPDRTWMQEDHVCSYDYNGKTGRIYVQATTRECDEITPYAVYSIDKAVIIIGDTVEALMNPSYDAGGSHRTDALRFEYDGFKFMYFHSSFTIGSQACHTMDCAVVMDLSDTMVEDGCTSERKLPVVCSRVDENGQYDDTLTDTFEPCHRVRNG